MEVGAAMSFLKDFQARDNDYALPYDTFKEQKFRFIILSVAVLIVGKLVLQVRYESPILILPRD